MRSWLDHDSPSDDGEVSLAAVAAELIELIAEHEPKWPRQWKNALADALHELQMLGRDDHTKTPFADQSVDEVLVGDGRARTKVRVPPVLLVGRHGFGRMLARILPTGNFGTTLLHRETSRDRI